MRPPWTDRRDGTMAALVAPRYFEPASPNKLNDALVSLALAGLANRHDAYLWLNASAPSWSGGVPVMWSYPDADAHWLSYLSGTRGVRFAVAADASPCTLLHDPSVSRAVRGVVRYDDGGLDAPRWLAVSAAGLYDGIPASDTTLARHPCLAALPTVFSIPRNFTTDLEAYAWAVTALLPRTSTELLVGACHSWANYSCGWGDPLGVAAVDLAISKRAMVLNLSPAYTHADQRSMFRRFTSHLSPLAVFSGWAEPEGAMVRPPAPYME